MYSGHLTITWNSSITIASQRETCCSISASIDTHYRRLTAANYHRNRLNIVKNLLSELSCRIKAMLIRQTYFLVLAISFLCISNGFPVKKPPTRPKKPVTIKKFDPFVGVKDSGKLLGYALSNNPIANVFKNTYSFFYWLPRKNIPFDTPWKLFGQSSCLRSLYTPLADSTLLSVDMIFSMTFPF